MIERDFERAFARWFDGAVQHALQRTHGTTAEERERAVFWGVMDALLDLVRRLRDAGLLPDDPAAWQQEFLSKAVALWRECMGVEL